MQNKLKSLQEINNFAIHTINTFQRVQKMKKENYQGITMSGERPSVDLFINFRYYPRPEQDYVYGGEDSIILSTKLESIADIKKQIYSELEEFKTWKEHNFAKDLNFEDFIITVTNIQKL